MESESLNIMRNGGFEPLAANRLPVVRKSFFSTQVWSKKEGEGPPLGFPLLGKADLDQK
jgi:hypothetical protein